MSLIDISATAAEERIGLQLKSSPLQLPLSWSNQRSTLLFTATPILHLPWYPVL
jgi:hypothetical protein